MRDLNHNKPKFTKQAITTKTLKVWMGFGQECSEVPRRGERANQINTNGH